MKIPALPLFVAAMSGWAAAQDPFTFETSARFGSTGDFNGDGRRDAVFADRVTGEVRVAFQLASGDFTWSSPQPSGIESPEALAVGRFYAVDAIAMSSSTANRIHLFSLGSAGEMVLPVPLYPTYPGPSAMAAMEIDGANTMDLVTVGEGTSPLPNTGKGKAYQSMVNIVGTPTASWTTSFSATGLRLNPARPKTGAAPRLCRIFHAPGSTAASFEIDIVTNGGLSGGIIVGGMTPSTRYVPTSLDGGALTQFLFWEPGGTTFQVRRIQEPSAGTFTIGSAASFTLPAGIQMITPIPQGGTGRIAVLFADGSVSLYGFNGVSAPTFIQSLTGLDHEMILPLENGSFLVGSNLRGTNPAWKRFNPSGGTFTQAFGGNLEFSGTSRGSNILFLSAEPFVNPTAEARQLTRFRDWTSTAVASGNAWNVRSHGFAAAGLTTDFQTTTLSGTTASDFPLVNQYAPGISMHILQPAAGVNPVDLVFSPKPGTYDPPATDDTPALVVTIAATSPGYQIYYRRDPSQTFTKVVASTTLNVLSSTTFQAYAQHPTTGVRTPMRQGTYIINSPQPLAASALVDLDNDGMADEWERTFGLDNPSADADGDGVSNLSEYISGTDPRDAASAPPAALAINATTFSSGGVNYLRLEWQDPAAVLKRSPDLVSWGPHGATIQTIGNGFRADIPMTGAVPAKAFYRLEK